jgi:hypothetical protein
VSFHKVFNSLTLLARLLAYQLVDFWVAGEKSDIASDNQIKSGSGRHILENFPSLIEYAFNNGKHGIDDLLPECLFALKVIGQQASVHIGDIFGVVY